MPLASALLVIAALVVIAAILGVVWRVRDGRRRRGAGTIDLSELGGRPGRLALVQFSTETCSRCPQVRRMLRSAASDRPSVDVLDVDLTHRPDLAARHHVLSTPTTLVVDADSRVTSRFVGVPRPADLAAALDALPALQEA
ncbi:thioredoxin family protein [Microbacterium sp. H1-D42]|uniref:thioredoxin family protein n=1 Tax=Microbacterium sp. H1-D42 TaxID=2925844 RepID=UPI001F538BEA|nr:thioredoxin family protein [Microbacterium sp. H1-D42]UNK69526.1 thioredoxin family protein [Microbacterium sp. H1-D42]